MYSCPCPVFVFGFVFESSVCVFVSVSSSYSFSFRVFVPKQTQISKPPLSRNVLKNGAVPTLFAVMFAVRETTEAVFVAMNACFNE